MTNPNPFHTLREMAAGYFLPRCLHVIADLAVADVLDETPRTAADLAAAVGAHPDALGRVLRLLSAYGVFESRDDKFRHSPASRLLRTDHPQSMRDFARMCGLSINWAVSGQLDYSVRTGLPAADRIHPGGFWAYLAENPEANSIFNSTMTAKAHNQVAGILASYDFSGFGLIGDIGGGRGHLLRAVLDSAPTARGVLFDQPHVIKETAGMPSERLTLQAGDFFNDTLPVCDAYLVMEVIHDWADKEAVAILKAVRQAAPSHAKLLLLETMIPSDPGPDWSKILDILMLNWAGGRQRTLQEYETLFDSAGFSFTREIETGADISIIEARTA